MTTGLWEARIQGLLADPVPAADLRRHRPALLLTQHADDLPLAEPILPHRPSPDDGLSYRPSDPQGSRSPGGKARLASSLPARSRPRCRNAIRPIKERMGSRGPQDRKSQAFDAPYSDPSHERADPPEIPVCYRSVLIAMI
jgi:hypothetical protein